MPVSIEDEMKEEDHFLDAEDDSSDESDSDSADDSSDDESGDDDSDSDSDDDSDDDDDDNEDDESGSDSDSDDDDSDDDSDSGSGSGSGSESDDSSTKKKKKKKSKKSKDDEKKKEEDEDDLGGNAIFRIQQISTKLSYLLDDLHRTFKPKSIPKIDPQSVFPYPYKSLPTDSPKRLWRRQSQEQQAQELNPNMNPELTDNAMNSPQRHFSTHCKSPISSPIRHGDHVDRGAGGNYIYPSYAAPPSQHEIKKLYKNYSDKERHKIAQNQQRERERKFLSSRTGRTPRRSRRDIAWEYETGNFSEEFISASNRRRNSPNPNHLNHGHCSYRNENELDPTMPSTFDELYKHYDAERRLLEQKQNKMQRMRNKLYWFKRNNSERPLDREEKVPLKKMRDFKNTQSLKSTLHRSMNNRDREKNLLNKAAEVLLGNNSNGSNSSPKGRKREDEYDDINGMEVSPDSLQEKIMQIAEEEDDLVDDGHRLPTFV